MGSRRRIGQAVAAGLLAFYDIDTPVTLAALAAGSCYYLSAELIPGFDLYLSFTGGPVLRLLEHRYGARAARVLYCGVDPDCHRPVSPTRNGISVISELTAAIARQCSTG